jgi:hypothetical protein
MDEQDPSDTPPPEPDVTKPKPPGRVRLRWRKRKLFPRVGPNGEPLPAKELATRSEYMRSYMRQRRAQLKGGAQKHGKPGRPRQPGLENRFVPSAENREVVKLLAGFAVPKDRICRCVRNPETRRPIGIPTLEKHFADELDTGFAELNALVCGKLAKKIAEGNVVAIIWTMKNLYGWSDVREVHSHSDVDMKVELSGEELAREMERRGLPTVVFDAPKPRLIDAPPRSNGHDDDGGA